MKKILVFLEYFIPGFKGGGPIKSVLNMVNFLKNFEFYIITKDRDLGENKSYPHIKSNEWNERDSCKIYYKSKKQSIIKIIKIINELDYDFQYFNSFFSIKETLIFLILKKINLLDKNKKSILAPRGELFEGSMNIKKFRKMIYIFFFKLLGLQRLITFHASNEIEAEKIRKYFKDTPIKIATNIVLLPISKNIETKKKNKNELNIVFLSRISKKKNLEYCFTILSSVIKYNINFNIYGTIEDKRYWKKISKMMEQLPHNIKVNYKGEYESKELDQIFEDNHLFFFPTLGENFGHVIIESLCHGCPVLISDQTPWRNLEKAKVGWDIPLEKPELFIDVINYMAELDNEKYLEFCNNCFNYCEKIFCPNELYKSYMDLFT